MKKALQLYSLLLKLYPTSYQKQFGTQMMQTFQDYYSDASYKKSQIPTLLFFILDELQNIIVQQSISLKGGEYQMNKYVFGVSIGIIMSVIVVLTNVVFPNNAPDNENLVGLAYLALLFIFGVGGYVASKKSKHTLKDGAIGGAITAFIIMAMIMLTFAVVDNVFLDVVSKQADKISGFTQQRGQFHSMRDYINYGLLMGSIIVLPVVTVVGAFFGALGARIRKYRWAK